MPVFAKFAKGSALYYKGEKVRMENERELSKLYDEYEIKNQ